LHIAKKCQTAAENVNPGGVTQFNRDRGNSIKMSTKIHGSYQSVQVSAKYATENNESLNSNARKQRSSLACISGHNAGLKLYEICFRTPKTLKIQDIF